MPTSILETDTLLPRAKDGDSRELAEVKNYLYLLLEQLRYTLGNLDRDNFNETGLGEIAEEIREPIRASIADTAGNVAALSLTAEALAVRIGTAEGSVSTLTQTAEAISTRVTDAEGRISQLTQTAAGLTSRITTAEGNVSSLQQTATALTSRISTAEGNISTISQTVNSITLGVSNGSTSSTISLYRNGIAVSSQIVQFTGKVVFASDLTDGVTQISGDNIQTGSLTGLSLNSVLAYNASVSTGNVNFYYIAKQQNNLCAGLRLDDQGAGTAAEAKYRLLLYTNSVAGTAFAMKLRSAGNMSLEADSIYLVGNVYVNGTKIS